MSNKTQKMIAKANQSHSKLSRQTIENSVFENKEIIQIRELDKRYTHANPNRGKCIVESCTNSSTHWLTRQNTHYCQSDMVCNQHAMLWMQVKELIVFNI